MASMAFYAFVALLSAGIAAQRISDMGTAQYLPPCIRNQDTIGSWYNNTLQNPLLSTSTVLLSCIDELNFLVPGVSVDVNCSVLSYYQMKLLYVYHIARSSESNKQKYRFLSHFYGPGNGLTNAALDFTDVWLPHGCSYHRFTNSTLHQCAAYFIEKQPKSDGYMLPNSSDLPMNNGIGDGRGFFHIAVIGDSLSRGILCGIFRLLSGTELLGPVYNNICGDGATFRIPMTYTNKNQCRHVVYGNIMVTFCYFMYLMDPPALIKFRQVIAHRPYAIVYNSAAFDFQNYSVVNHRMNIQTDPFTHNCSALGLGADLEPIVKMRVSPERVQTLLMLATEARAIGIRPIYRNNHFNSRFSAYCADERLE